MRDTCTVTNKSTGRVVYKVPDMNIRREFRPRETKKNIPVKELESLVAQGYGQKVLLYNYLMIHEEDVIRYLINGEVAPEYWLTEDKIPEWMNSCTLDEFKDALDFAPRGTKDLIKKYAVELPLQDYSKRQAVKDILDFDVTKAIENFGTDEESSENAAPKNVRRTTSSIQAPITVKKD